MITVETNRPVDFSSANGSEKDQRRAERKSNREERKTKRQTRRSSRKAKKNATKLKTIVKGGVTKIVKPFKKVFTKKDGSKYKKAQDGTEIPVKSTDVVKTPQGEYDKTEISQATGVPADKITTQTVSTITVPTQPTSPTADATSVAPASDPNADLSGIVPESSVVETDEGLYLNSETQPVEEPTKDVAQEEKKSKEPLKKWEKGLLWGGVGVVVLIVGIVAFKYFKNKGKSNG
jgi:hypothetical protein